MVAYKSVSSILFPSSVEFEYYTRKRNSRLFFIGEIWYGILRVVAMYAMLKLVIKRNVGLFIDTYSNMLFFFFFFQKERGKALSTRLTR